MTRLPTALLIASAGVFGMSVAAAQNAGPAAMSFADPPHKNLKILPQDMPRAELLATMKFFSQSLGVRCTFCHVGEEGKPLSSFDFASDEKKHKQVARKMLAMVHRINSENFGVTDLSKAKVTCFTCHRGSEHPLTAPPAPAPVAVTPAPAAKSERG